MFCTVKFQFNVFAFIQNMDNNTLAPRSQTFIFRNKYYNIGYMKTFEEDFWEK